MQIVINIIHTSILYLLVAISFLTVFNTMKFFIISQAAFISLGAYLVFYFYKQMGFPILYSILISIVINMVFNTLLNRFVFYPLKKKDSSPFILLISSLGIYIILQNLISLIWGDTTKILNNSINIGHEMAGAYVTNIQIISIIVGIIIFILIYVLSTRTRYGLKIRSIFLNEKLANNFGISFQRIVVWVSMISTFMATVAGILVAFDIGIRPTMGFNFLLYGIIAMIIGGVGSIWGTVWGSLLLATAQHLGAYYINSKWMDAIAYIILILFLIWKPLGFSGKQLKKVEI